MSDDPVRAAQRAPAALFRKIRGALFEVEQPNAHEPATAAMLAQQSGSDVDPAALATLRDVARRELGAAYAEFELQSTALVDVVQDESARLHVALRVLAGRGLSLESLLAELEAGLHALELARRSWEEKVSARRAEHELERAELDAAHQRATSDAASEIERLKACIGQAEQALAQADRERSERAAAVESAAAELTARDAGFRAAEGVVRAERSALIEKLRASTKESS